MSLLAFTKKRFWEKVNIINDSDSCWNWIAANDGRYGRFFFEGKPRKANRMALVFSDKLSLSSSECVLHKCDNTLCVRPDHLYLGNQKMNALDRKTRNRQADLSGARNPNAKLTVENIEEIKKTPRSIRHIELSKKFGVSPERIGQIRKESGEHYVTV